MLNLKIKPLTKEQIIISIDRLTRFKDPETKYLRVFKDIIINNLINPKFKKSDLDKMDYEELKSIAQEIINTSLNENTSDNTINKKILEYEKSIFELNSDVEKLINNNINYKACIKKFTNEIPKNLQWLKCLDSNIKIKELRQKNAFHFPVEKLIIAEGATEEILLPEFGKFCNYDFDKNGVHIIAAGGKNQVVKSFYEFAQIIKIPIFVLLDKDGNQNAIEIKPKLRSFDKIHIIECGEFEDLLPKKLVERTINYELKNISILESKNFDKTTSRVEVLEEIFKTRGMHEFKKAEFARMIKTKINSKEDISPEIDTIINEIKNLKK